MVRFVDSLLRTTIAFARDRQRLVLVKLLFPLNLVVASFAKSRVHQSIDQFRHLTTLVVSERLCVLVRWRTLVSSP